MRQKSSIWWYLPTSLGVLIIFSISLWPFTATAQVGADFSFRPLFIDKVSEPRDIITETITLYNQLDRPLRLYASVHEISLDGAGEIKEFISPAMTDRATNVASWLEISRARLEVPPLGELAVPLTIRVSPNAPPGSYHAFIGFASGHNRDVAESTILSGRSQGAVIKITLPEKSNEQIQLLGLTTKTVAALGGQQIINFTLRNTGDTAVTPTSEIILYDTRGREVAALDLGSIVSDLPPGTEQRFEHALPPVEDFGRYKAMLNIQYGKNQAAVFDSTYFVSIPWSIILVLIGSVLTLLISIWLLLRNRRPVEAVGSTPVHEVGVYVRPRQGHVKYDHDLNLKQGR